tara:strand:+ start:1587 stop:2240 length:654 start_codon:yes stop_codon:yes gene_type:complete
MSKIIDGIEYIKKTDVEAIIKERVGKVAARASESEVKRANLEQKLKDYESKIASIDILGKQVEDYKTQLENSRLQFSRHKEVSKLGLFDQDIIDAFNWQYERDMSKLGKKDRLEFGNWLDSIKENPDQAPTILKPHLFPKNGQIADSMQRREQQPPQQQPQPPQQPRSAPLPQMNRGAHPSPTQEDHLSMGLRDGDYYRKNRDAIKELWYSRQKQRG